MCHGDPVRLASARRVVPQTGHSAACSSNVAGNYRLPAALAEQRAYKEGQTTLASRTPDALSRLTPLRPPVPGAAKNPLQVEANTPVQLASLRIRCQDAWRYSSLNPIESACRADQRTAARTSFRFVRTRLSVSRVQRQLLDLRSNQVCAVHPLQQEESS